MSTFGNMHLSTKMTKLDLNHWCNSNQQMYSCWGLPCIILSLRYAISIILWWCFHAWAKSLEYNVHNCDFKVLWKYWSLLYIQNLCNFMISLNFVIRISTAVHLFWKLMWSEFEKKCQNNQLFASLSSGVKFSMFQLHS